MTLDLHNFFKYYDKNNPKHVAAVEQLEKDLLEKESDLMQDEANWVRIFRTKIEPPSAPGVLKVPFFPQTDNYTLPDATCNSSSCAMCLEYFKPGTLKGEKGDDAYLQKVLALGKSTDHSVQTRVLSSYGVDSYFSTNLTFANIDRQLSNNKPVVIGFLHRGPLSAPRGGHVVVIIGKKGEDYVVNDPYGSLNDGYTGPVTNGKGAVYKKSELAHRWCPKGNDGWGRIFEAKK